MASINERELMIIADLIEKIKDVLNDQKTMSLIAELIVNKGQTLDDLESRPYIKLEKETLQSKLDMLEDYNLIYSETPSKGADTEKETSVSKKYYIETNEFEKLFERMLKYEHFELVKESRLTFIYLVKIFLTREIELLLHLNQEDYIKKLSPKYKEKGYVYGGIQFLKEDEFNFYNQKLVQIQEEVREYIRNKNKNKKIDTNSLETPYLIYFGNLYFPELDSSESR